MTIPELDELYADADTVSRATIYLLKLIMNPVLGPNTLHWASKLCKTHYREFRSPLGIDGLAKEANGGKTLHLLAVHAQYQGQGNFRNFIAEAKKHYTQISVWEIKNVILESALNRYGFSHTEQTQYGETVTGMTWKQ